MVMVVIEHCTQYPRHRSSRGSNACFAASWLSQTQIAACVLPLPEVCSLEGAAGTVRAFCVHRGRCRCRVTRSTASDSHVFSVQPPSLQEFVPSAPLLSQVPSMLQAILLAVALATVAAKSGKGGRKGYEHWKQLRLCVSAVRLADGFSFGGLTTLKSPLDESAWEAWRDRLNSNSLAYREVLLVMTIALSDVPSSNHSATSRQVPAGPLNLRVKLDIIQSTFSTTSLNIFFAMVRSAAPR